MKHILLLLWLLCSIGTGLQAQHVVKLRGTVINRLSDSITVTLNTNRIAYFPQQYHAVLDAKGQFKLSFPLPCENYYIVEVAHENHVAEIVVQCGDSLDMTVNGKYFDSSVTYKGRGANIQNFVAKHTHLIGRMNHYSLLAKEAINYGQEDFLKKLTELKTREMKFLADYKKQLPASFIRYWDAYFTYYNYFFMQQYPKVHEIIRLRRYTDTIPQENYNIIQHMAYSYNDSLLALPPYLLYLTGVPETKLKSAGFTFFDKDTATARIFLDSMNQVAYHDMPPQSAAFYNAQALYARIRYQPLPRTLAQYQELKQHPAAAEYLPTLEQQITIAERLAPGKTAPDFEFTDQNGAVKKLSSLQGKVVFLTFWASWCKQCVSEMMPERKVKEYFKNKPVEFLNVSIGNDTAAENTLIRKYKIDGTFTDVEGGWDAPLAKLYGVQAMPAYFIIDPDGNFAPYLPPSPRNTTEMIIAISKLLK
jgi:peroxiredoxin